MTTNTETMTATTMNGLEVSLKVYEPISGVTVLEDGWKELLAAAIRIAVEPKDGEQIRIHDGLDLVVEVRREGWYSFEVRLEDECSRFAFEDIRRMANGDVAKGVKLVTRASWSCLGTVPVEAAIEFAKRLNEVVAQVERGFRLWARGQEFVRIYETAAKELERAEDLAISRLIQAAWREQIPEAKKNLNSKRKLSVPALGGFAGRTFEIYMPKDAKGRTLLASVTVFTGGACVAVKA
ncbi:MAG TPA: hypothetical protein VMW52_10190 [Phycisphaerae bacterium]|nr:hypothetical protein [Phycisphaerae bacterium]